jgi:hypothetical protein
MLVDWGNVPTWVASIATSGTLITGMILLAQSQHERLVSGAAPLVATLDTRGPKREWHPLTMRISNPSPNSFREVMVYRQAEVRRSPGGAVENLWCKAVVSVVPPWYELEWTVEDEAQLATGLRDHPKSFETFQLEGTQIVRYRGKAPVVVRGLARRRLRQHVSEFTRGFESTRDATDARLLHEGVATLRMLEPVRGPH